MKLTERGKIWLAVMAFAIFAVSLLYNFSRDPRSLHDSTGDKNDERLLEQRQRRSPKKKNPSQHQADSSLRIDLLKQPRYKYRNVGSRNIFAYGRSTEKIPRNSGEIKKTAPVQTIRKTENKTAEAGRFTPYRFIGFASIKNRRIAFLEHKPSNKISMVYEGQMLGSEYQVKEINRKKVILFETGTKQDHEITRNE